jgi:sugar lactone lactonase YvrE
VVLPITSVALAQASSATPLGSNSNYHQIRASDVFISGWDVSRAEPLSHVRQFSATQTGVTLSGTLTTTDQPLPFGMAFDSGGNLYVANYGSLTPGAGSVTRFAGPNLTQSTGLFANTLAGQTPQSIAFDAAGNAYVGTAGALGGTGDVYRFNAAGALTGQFNVTLDAVSSWIDLANNQATLFYTSGSRRIQRWDVAANAAMADFAVLPGAGQAFELKLLPDGGLLLADGPTVKRLDAAGNVVWTADPDPTEGDTYFSLALDPDGQSFWVLDINTETGPEGDSSDFFRLSLDGGLLLAANTGTNFTLAGGIGVRDEPREAFRVAVSEPAPWTLLGLGLLTAAWRSRSRRATRSGG